MNKIIINLLFLLVCATALLGCGNSGTSTEESKTKEVGEQIKLTDLDGNAIELSQYKGKVVFLNIWATWCAPCIKEMPSIEAASKALGDEVVFLLASDESVEKIQAFKSKKSFDLNFIKLNSNLEQLGVYALPATFVFDKNGKIAFEEKGMRDWSSPESLKLLREAGL